MQSLTVVILTILLSVLINLLITLIIRKSDRNQKTIKNINNQIQTFRSEVAAVTERIKNLEHETVTNVETKVSLADQTIARVAESLETLSEHSNDLSALQAVCVSYKNALEKLRVATDQAEARIIAVQDEVRKAEEISDFTRAFQSEAERLRTDLEAIRSEHARLVSSTSESLKAAAENQKNENQDMLQEFAVAMEGFKTRFADFIGTERASFEGFFRERSEAIASDAAALDEKKEMILASLEEGEKRLDEYRSTIDAAIASYKDVTDTLGREASETLESLNRSIADEKQLLSSYAENCTADLTAKADELRTRTEDELMRAADDTDRRRNLFAESCAQMLDETKARLDKELSLFNEAVEISKSSVLAFIESSKEDAERAAEAAKAAIAEGLDDVERARTGLADTESQFRENAYNAISGSFEELIGSVDETYQRIRKDGDEFLRTLADNLLQTRETISLLSEGESSNISSTVEHLQSLDQKIKSSESTLSELSESLTSTREDIFEAQQELGRVESEIKQKEKDLQGVFEEMKGYKAQTMQEKAEISRLKVERDKLRNSIKDEKKPEDLIQAFPDDIEI